MSQDVTGCHRKRELAQDPGVSGGLSAAIIPYTSSVLAVPSWDKLGRRGWPRPGGIAPRAGGAGLPAAPPLPWAARSRTAPTYRSIPVRRPLTAFGMTKERRGGLAPGGAAAGIERDLGAAVVAWRSALLQTMSPVAVAPVSRAGRASSPPAGRRMGSRSSRRRLPQGKIAELEIPHCVRDDKGAVRGTWGGRTRVGMLIGRSLAGRVVAGRGPLPTDDPGLPQRIGAPALPGGGTLLGTIPAAAGPSGAGASPDGAGSHRRRARASRAVVGWSLPQTPRPTLPGGGGTNRRWRGAAARGRRGADSRIHPKVPRFVGRMGLSPGLTGMLQCTRGRIRLDSARPRIRRRAQ